ncbi:MAG TPA: hypothetical protein VGM81_10030 [Burkholderiaceae bacterium]|jgi:hypothetical protein
MNFDMFRQMEGSTDRALLRELARLGNLLAELTHAIRVGSLAGNPLDSMSVLQALERIEQKLAGLRTERRTG